MIDFKLVSAFIVDGVMWVRFFHPSYPRTKVVVGGDIIGRRWRLDDVAETLFFRPAYPWVPFIPTSRQFEGRLVNSLKMIKLEETRNQFRLCESIEREWSELDRWISIVSDFLRGHFVAKYPQYAQYTRPPRAAMTPLRTYHRDRQVVWRTCLQARDRFCLRLAELSFLLSFFSDRQQWVVTECSLHHVPEDVMESLWTSCVVTHGTAAACVGSLWFLDRTLYSTCFDLLNHYISVGIPVCYPWTSVDEEESKRNVAMLQFKPPRYVCEAAYEVTERCTPFL